MKVRGEDITASDLQIVQRLEGAAQSGGGRGAHPALEQLLADHYRFADTSLEFSLRGAPSDECGYFRFGRDVTCFGRCSTGSVSKTANRKLYDAIDDVAYDGQTVSLPFDPGEIINNLRYEHYAAEPPRATKSALRSFVRDTYYLVRPALHVSLRKRLQKLHLNGWHELVFPEWPVDRTVDRLMRRLLNMSLRANGIKRLPFIWFWPEGASACAIMTHDVETRAGQNFCPQLMDIDEAHGIPASFQIVPEKRYPVTAQFLQSLKSRGFEVNIQDLNHDGLLFSDEQEFRRRADKINSYAQEYQAHGFRSAILYRNQDWYGALNFEYDMSVPNVAHLDPQRGGCCTVMPYFVGKTLELPVTTTQDYSLFHILNDYSLALWKQQVELIMEENGLIAFIVHPDYIVSEQAQATYRKLLTLVQQLRAERNVWVARPQQVNDWWRTRSQLRLQQHQGEWRIEGPGSERARLAFATASEDGLVYSFS